MYSGLLAVHFGPYYRDDDDDVGVHVCAGGAGTSVGVGESNKNSLDAVNRCKICFFSVLIPSIGIDQLLKHNPSAIIGKCIQYRFDTEQRLLR